VIVLLRPGYSRGGKFCVALFITTSQGTANEDRDGLGTLPVRIELVGGASRRRTRGSTVNGGQASKGIRWMPWHQEAMKDVAKLR
jgi:hypothetical protein